MSADERIRSRRGILSPMLILGAIMTIFYLGLGGYILIDRSFLPKIPSEFRSIFAGMLIIYGLYRGWRTWADHGRPQQ